MLHLDAVVVRGHKEPSSYPTFV
uniref:Uncharacterized protein n=1 Tax=Rhizophora mucronata TaxID=61149 RepID=A0A2P2NSE6_RHIMU